MALKIKENWKPEEKLYRILGTQAILLADFLWVHDKDQEAVSWFRKRLTHKVMLDFEDKL